MRNLSRKVPALPALFVLLWLLTPATARGQQETQPKRDQADEFRDMVKGLFGDLGPVLVPDKAGETPEGKSGGADRQNPFGGLLRGLLGEQKGGARDCQTFITMAFLQDQLAAGGNTPGREAFRKLQDNLMASQQAIMQQNWEDHIRLGREALAAEKQIGEWPSALPRGILLGNIWTNLSVAYFYRQRGDRAENLESGIEAVRKALELLPKEGTCADQRNIAQTNLGAAYTQRIRGERAENIDLAIAAFEATLQSVSRETEPQIWALAQSNLGGAYMDRIRGRTKDNQERGIEALKAALQVWDRDRDPARWALAQSNLGSSYSRRISGDRAGNIEEAIAAFEAALSVGNAEAGAPTGSTPPAGGKTPDEAELLKALQGVTGAADAIKGSESGAVTISEPGRWANTYHNLANAYRKRIRGDRADNIERAIAAHETSLTVWTRETHAEKWAWAQSELGESYMLRLKGDRSANVDRALDFFRLALKVRTPEGFPRGHLTTATALGQALSAKGDWTGAVEAFEAARTSFRVLFGQGLDEIEARNLLQEAGPLFTDAAYAAVARGEPQRAFELLEEGKARLLAIALKLDRLPVSDAERKTLEALRRRIREEEAAYEGAQGEDKAARIAQLRQLRGQLLKLVDAAEAKAGQSRAKDLQAAGAEVLQDNGALIAPIVSETGGKAILVVSRNGRVAADAIDLPGVDRNRLGVLLGARDQGGWLGAYAIQHLDAASQAKRLPEWFKAIESTGDELGRLFAVPLVDALAARGIKPGTGAQLTILPIGPLGLLPLGLARQPATGRHLSEDYTVNFAPSLAALASAKSRAGKRGGEPDLAVIANPTGDLPFTELEGALVASRFAAPGRHSLIEKQATSKAVLAALKGSDYWHFSSHGYFDWDEPRESGLLMAMRQPLTVGALMDANDMSAPRLAVLSACETGLYDIVTTPNEFTGLPAAFMRLGAGGVLATLWPVNDLSTALLIARFYDLHRGETLPPAAALRGAQGWLRNARQAELKAYLRGAVEEGRLPREFMQSIDAVLRAATASGGSEPPFAHPYYWSGFTLTGF